MMSPRIFCLIGSIAAHTTVFAVGNVAFVSSARYAIEPGDGGVEANMIAAPIELILQEKDIVMLSQHEIEEEAVVAEEMKEDTAQAVSEKTGDGSSPVPGEDATTYQASGGALSEAKADYLRNPAPAYPWEARQKGWEGVVVLKVEVSREGHPSAVVIKKSSGHGILDDSALHTVRRWRFRPAQAGDLPMESTVLVPARFQLEDLKR